MEILLTFALFIPAALMILAGVLLSLAKKDSTMSRHHFAGNFNIKGYSRRIITLFTITGLLFTTGGLLMVNEHLVAGLVLLFVSLIVFLICFIRLQKKS